MRTRRPWWAQLCYVIGGLLFNVETLSTQTLAIYVCATAGSCLFVAGATLEVAHNDGFTHFRPQKLAFWTAWTDLFGSFLFLAGSLAGFFEREDVVDWCFVVGSFFFLGSSICGLWMWKVNDGNPCCAAL